MRASASCFSSSFAAGVLLALCSAAVDPSSTWAASYQVSSWTFGDPTSLAAAADRDAIDEVAADWYLSRRDSTVLGIDEDPAYVAAAHARGLRVLATVTDQSPATRAFSAGISAYVLHKPERIAAHVVALVSLCASRGYDGIDLDWEAVRPLDKRRFSGFVAELATALHAAGKILAIAVHAKTSEPGTWSGPKAQDWPSLGAAVDELKVMTYDFSGPWSPPGPIAPLSWVGEVLTHAETLVPAAKIWMGVPFYGRDWRGRRTTDLTWSDAQASIVSHGASVAHDPSGEAFFTYRLPLGGLHTTYFQDRSSIAAKLAFLRAEHPAIAGIAIWVMGGEDPAFWDEIALQLR